MPTLYIDMDGVVADFNLAAKLALNATDEDVQLAAQNGRWPDEQWQQLIRIPNFYRTLPLIEIGKNIISLARKFRDDLGWRICFLTAIPSTNDVPDCIHDKILWVQENYGDLRVRFGPYSKDKSKQCQPGDILIDDRSDLCADWQQAGGIAINFGVVDALTQLQVEFDQRINS